MAFYLLQEDGNKILLEDLSGFIILEETLIGPTLFHQGDGKRRNGRYGKRRLRTQELFSAMEQTLRRVLTGEVDAPTVTVAQVGPAAVVLDTTEPFEASVTQLRRLADRTKVLSTHLTSLFQAFTEYEKRKVLEMDDEEMWALV
jgi:hypothetical protein